MAIGRPGTWEILIVVVIIVVLFGPKFLPKLGQTFGDTIRGFKNGLKGDEEEAENTDVNNTEA
ncbi:MAG: twin-arginine translocase TatA/TatE family subunit [Lachnospiraceae bacterium]|nr:twin-arginine translocase TatA/TatE family subunit [Lachnospiraceae bacterium]